MQYTEALSQMCEEHDDGMCEEQVCFVIGTT